MSSETFGAQFEARMLARGLSPVQLESDGLMSALQELVSTTEQLFNISCRFDCEQPVLIEDNATATHLYRIAQEAIHNAIKHGQATHVSVALAHSGEHTLTISDDGLGLPAELCSSKGMGAHHELSGWYDRGRLDRGWSTRW